MRLHDRKRVDRARRSVEMSDLARRAAFSRAEHLARRPRVRQRGDVSCRHELGAARSIAGVGCRLLARAARMQTRRLDADGLERSWRRDRRSSPRPDSAGERLSMLAAALTSAGVRQSLPDRCRTTRPRTARRSSAGSTCGRARHLGRRLRCGPHDLVRTIEAELGVEEVFWKVAVEAGQSRSRSACGTARSCSACPGTPSRRSSASSCSCDPPFALLQGARDPEPAFAQERSAAPCGRNPRARASSCAHASRSDGRPRRCSSRSTGRSRT